VSIPSDIQINLLSSLLMTFSGPTSRVDGKIMYHDSRTAYLIAEGKPSHLAIMPGYLRDEGAFGRGNVYEAPRRFLDQIGAERVFGTWTRGLAKSCGADDGLWLTYPQLAQGLARQRLDYAKSLGVGQIVTDSPLCADWMAGQATEADPLVSWLPEILLKEITLHPT
jgi:hypothetical protein